MSHLEKKSAFVPVVIILLFRMFRYRDVFNSHIRILLNHYPMRVRFRDRCKLIHLAHWLPYHIECGSTQVEVLTVVNRILSICPDMVGSVIEVGVFKGGASCVFSKACALANRTLYLVDSFEGIPENDEMHRNLHKPGGVTYFREGDYKGELAEVRHNITTYGEPAACKYLKGYVEQTLPHFKEKCVVVYSDVDLASATLTILKYLYPLLQPGARFFSQDGHLSLVAAVFDDNAFWKTVCKERPNVIGLHESKLIWFDK